jgi:hypothetical protein
MPAESLRKLGRAKEAPGDYSNKVHSTRYIALPNPMETMTMYVQGPGLRALAQSKRETLLNDPQTLQN